LDIKDGQPIPVDQLIDPEVTLHPTIFKWREALTVDKGLLDSLKTGQLQPVIFRMKKDKHELLIGSRRYFHQKLLGTSFKNIPKEVKHNISDRDALMMAASENIFRQDFTPFEEARVISDLAAAKIQPKVIAEKFKVSQSYIYSRLALMKLPNGIIKRFEAKGIPMSFAPSVMKLEGEAQMSLVEKIEQGMESRYNGISTVKEAEEYIFKLEKQIKEKEELLRKYGTCPKCDSKDITNRYGDDLQLYCRDCSHTWNAETREPWEYYELKQAAAKQGIEIVETAGKLELTPRDVSELMKKEERLEEARREEKPEGDKDQVEENFRSKISLEDIIIPLLIENIQKVVVKGSSIDIEFIEDTKLHFKGLKKNYKSGELARIETQHSWSGDIQETAKMIHEHIKKVSGE